MIFSFIVAMSLVAIVGGGHSALRKHRAIQMERQRRLDARLYEAASRAELETVRSLLEEGANPNGGSPPGLSPLYGVIDQDVPSIAAAKLLLDSGAEIDVATGAGRTALSSAVDSGKDEIACFLLDAGANPNVKANGRHGPGDITPLHRAGYSERLVRALIARGGDVNARTSDGETPIFWTLRGCGGRHTGWGGRVAGRSDAPLIRNASESLRCVRALIEAGAEVNAMSLDGVRPLDLVELQQWEMEFDLFKPSDEAKTALQLLKAAGAIHGIRSADSL